MISRQLLNLAVLVALVIPSPCIATAVAGQRPEGRTLLQVSASPVVVAASSPPKPHVFLAPRVVPTEMVSGVGATVSKAASDLYGEITNLPVSWRAYWPTSYWGKVLECVGSWAIWSLLALLIYSCGVYPDVKRVFVREEDPDPKRTFLESHFGCFKSPRICICSFCCPALRWADTEHMVGLSRTTAALAAFLGAALVNCLFLESIWFGVATALLIILFRQKLRKKLSLPNWTLGSCCIDFLFVCFCPCCAIAQEARVANAVCQLEAKEKSVGPPERPISPSRRWVLGDSTGMMLPPQGRGRDRLAMYRPDVLYPPATRDTFQGSPVSQGELGSPRTRFNPGFAGSLLPAQPVSPSSRHLR